jgi:DNA-binding NtrC family response regulator
VIKFLPDEKSDRAVANRVRTIVGDTKMRQMFTLSRDVGASATVLIEGETGTSKLIAGRSTITRRAVTARSSCSTAFGRAS